MFRKNNTPFYLRARFLVATVGVIFALSLSYGVVAVVGYLVNFNKNTFRDHRGESNLFFSFAQWKNNKLTVAIPADIELNIPTLALIYDDNGNILWRQRHVPELEPHIKKSWLRKPGFYEIDTGVDISSVMLGDNSAAQSQLRKYEASALSHSVSVNIYPATLKLPQLTIVVIDTMPQELQRSDQVWNWFIYVLLANLLLVIPLLWLAAYWSLRPIKALVNQVGQLEKGTREQLDENPPCELLSLVRNLNILLRYERQRYNKYRTTLSDLTHSLKTPLAVLQSTLRSLRTDKQTTIESVEPIMLEQIGRISQQIGYFLHRANMHSEHNVLNREIHSVPTLLDSLCNALKKVYQRKGVVLTLDMSPEITFLGEKNDFIEIMGNVLENACKYCLEFVEVTSIQTEQQLTIVIDDDGPGILPSQRNLIFQRGQRVDTLRPGQGLGLSMAAEIIEQYQGKITIDDSPMGGAKVLVSFGRQ